MSDPKPGQRTTEFLALLIANAALIAGVVFHRDFGGLSNGAQVLAVAGVALVNGIYIAARTVLKVIHHKESVRQALAELEADVRETIAGVEPGVKVLSTLVPKQAAAVEAVVAKVEPVVSQVATAAADVVAAAAPATPAAPATNQ